jgi:hypothetical protein
VIRDGPLLLLLACGPPEEEPIVVTSSLIAEITVAALDEITADVVVTLQRKGGLDNQFYELDVDEEITVTIPGIVISLYSGQFDDQPVYTASVPNPPIDTDFVIALNRQPPRKTASQSRMSLPMGFELSGPASFSRGADDVDLTWTHPDQPDVLTLRVTGPCIDTLKVEVSDVGSYTIAAGTIAGDGNCPVEATLTRLRIGEVDPDLAGGNAVAFQQRAVAMSSTP